MKLYSRDYNILTDEEILEWNKVKKGEEDGTLFGRMNKFREYHKAAMHYSTLCPNNYLDNREKIFE